MKIEYVTEERVICEDDHPRVYYTLKDGEAVCGYCNKKFILRKENLDEKILQ